MIKAMFFDVDGTLYCNQQHCVLPSTITALHQLKEKGFLLFLNTNRTYDEVLAIGQDIVDLMDGMVLLGGSWLKTKEKDLEVPMLDPQESQRAIDYLNEHGLLYRWVHSGGFGYLNCGDDHLVGMFERAYTMHPQIKAYTGEPLAAILWYTHDDTHRDKVREILTSAEHMKMGYPNEVILKGASKSLGMKKMAEAFGLALDQCAAFGDGLNDADMLQMAEVGIAMGNGKDNCKAAADYVTDTQENDGLYKACLHYGWIERDFHEN